MENKLIITPSTVISVELLKSLCEEYTAEIGAGEYSGYLSKIRIRYVMERGKFGYAKFGDFFFLCDDLYVWTHDKKYKENHNQDVVDAIFNNECTREEYACRALFAGADTNCVDSNGEHIFVGDILEIDEEFGRNKLALCYLPYENVRNIESSYCFVLDNHSLKLKECYSRNFKITRVGTAYFQLDWSFDAKEMYYKIREFNGWYDTNEEYEDKVYMAKFTPNFDQEIWKYRALEILGVEEFNWR